MPGWAGSSSGLRRRSISLDIGFAQFPFQPIDFISQMLILDQVQKPLDQLAGIFDLDVAEVNLVKHGVISLSGFGYN